MTVTLAQRVRIAKRVAIFALAAYAAYLALANGFLMLGGMRLLTRGTNSVRVHFSSAWTLWPSVVHARNLEVTIQDHNVQSTMKFPEATITLRMLELPRRVFHATRVRGTGFDFRFRHRVMPESAKLPAVEALPPIAGFEDPPVFEALAPEAPIADDRYDLWTVELDDVDVVADDVWIEQFRYLGRARATGTFRLEPARSLRVGPASLALQPGLVVSGGRTAFSEFGGRIDARVRPFDVRGPTGFEVMRFISASARLHGDVLSGAAAELFMPEGARVEPKDATLAVDADLDDGVLSPSSKARLTGSSLTLRVGKIAAELGERWQIAGTGDRGDGGDVTFFAAVGSVRTECTSVKTSDASLALSSTSRDAAVPWAVRRVEASVRRASGSTQWDDVRATGRFNAEVSANRNVKPGAGSSLELSVSARAEDVRVTAGAGAPERWSAELPDARVSGHLGEKRGGSVSVDLKRVRTSIGGSTMTFDTSARLRSSSVDLENRRADLAGKVEVKDASLWNANRRIDDWWASVEVERMRLAAERSVDMDGRVVARFKNALPGLLALSEKDEIPDWIPNVLPLRGLSGTIGIRRRCQRLDIDVPRLEGGPLIGSGRIHNVPGQTSGAMLVRYQGVGLFSAGIALGEGGGVSPLAGDDWLSRKIERMAVEKATEPCHVVRVNSCVR